MPFFTQWVQQVLNIDLTVRNVPRKEFGPQEFPPSRVPTSNFITQFYFLIYDYKVFIYLLDFLNALKKTKIDYTMDGPARLLRSHGQTLYDIYSLRHGKCFERITDLVVWPGMSYI